MTRTFVLLYHDLRATEPDGTKTAAENSIIVSANQFRRQVKLLSGPDFRVCALDDSLRRTSSATSSRTTDIVITFDDGNLSNYQVALPILSEFGKTATFYVVADWIDQDPGFMTSVQLREMNRCGMTIGSHSCNHPFLPQLSPSALRHEIRDSKTSLEDMLGHEVKHFALPGGHFNNRVLEECWSAGYKSVATCKPRAVLPTARTVPRIEIRPSLTEEAFHQTFSRGSLLQLAAIEHGKSALRKTLGLQNYAALRRFAHRHVTISR